MTDYGLVADIGGTNARFALVPLEPHIKAGVEPLPQPELLAVTTLDGSKFDSLATAAEHYLTTKVGEYRRPRIAMLALAGHVKNGQVTMVNHHWAFSLAELQRSLDMEKLQVVNDFFAAASSVPSLLPTDSVQVGSGQPAARKPIAVTGPGTGLGLAAVVYTDSDWTVLDTEGGHGHFAPTDDFEIEMLKFLNGRFTRVSSERLLSGPGLENIYQAVSALNGCEKKLTAAAVSKAAIAGTDAECQAALDLFCAIFGSYAGDIALTMGASGGVYITGGIVPRMIDYLQQSSFRARFEAKGRMTDYVSSIPTYVVTLDQPGLLGCATQLQKSSNSRGR